jgi:RNA polymerase sigma-70 factor (ECF subfamily)
VTGAARYASEVREVDFHASTTPERTRVDAGSPPTFEGTYRAHAAAVSRWIRVLDPGADAEDLLHEVFIVVGRRLGSFRGDSALTTWLYAITLRVVGAERRKRKLRRLLFGRFAVDLVEERSAPATPEESTGRARASTILYSLLDELNERDRSMLILFELEGLPGKELSEVLGISEQSLWTALHRARSRLRDAYVSRFGGGEERP